MGTIRKRSKKGWTIQWDEPPGPDGKRRQRCKVIHGTRKEAEDELVLIELRIRTGEYVEPSQMTLAAFLERWLKHSASKRVSPKTLQEYERIISNHVIPALGNLLVQRITPMQIQVFYSKKLESGRLDGKGGLSPRSVLHVHTLLHRVFAQAVRWQILPRNPVDAVDPPRVPLTEMKVLSSAEIPALVDASRGTSLFLPIAIALGTGLRRGEILGLTWSSVDLEAGSLVVARSIEQTKAGVRAKEPKTHRSRRHVKMPGSLVRVLRISKAERMLKTGTDFNEDDFLCLREDGFPWLPDVLSHRFTDLIRTLDVTHVRFQDLRHTFATLSLCQGIHPKVVSEMLGHSSVNITLDTYSHVLPDMQDQAASLIDDVLRDAFKARNQ